MPLHIDIFSQTQKMVGVSLWSFLTQEYLSAFTHTKASLSGRAATLMCRAKGSRLQEVINWFNRNECHTFQKLCRGQGTKAGSAENWGEIREVP